MAFVSNMDEDEEQKQQGQSGPVSPVSGGAVHLAPSAGVGASAPGGAAATPAQGAGGSFATLDKYLAANQGQAEPLAGKITGAIGDQYGSLDKENQGVLQSLQGQVASAPGYTKGDSGLLSEESADPTAFAGDASKVTSFQKQLTNSYGGPNSAEGTNEFQGQQAKLNNAISQGNAQTTTAAGRTQLVGQNTARPTTGAVALNSAILSQDPNSLGKVESAYKPFQNLVSGLNTGASDVNKTIASEKADAASSSKAARDAITGQMTGLNTAVNDQLTQKQAAATARNQTLKQDLQSGKMSSDDLKDLGISQEQWDSLSAAQKAAATSEVVQSNQGQFGANTGTANIDLSDQLAQQDPNTVYNAGNVATADQYNKAGAFQTLLNGLNLDTPQLAINPANSAQAGTAPTNLNSYDYNTALQGAKDTDTAATTAAQAYVDALQAGADEEHAQLAAQKAQKINTVATTANLANMTAAPIKTTQPFVQAGVNEAKSTASSPTRIAANILTGGASGASTAIAKGAVGAVNTVANIFCFHEHTPVSLKVGGEKMIKDIELGDQTLGGEVLAIKVAYSDDMYSYYGIYVTGKHAVHENGMWIRVEDTLAAIPVPGMFQVYNLVTADHRIWANGIMFADEYETDAYESLDMDESLETLNAQPVR